IVVQVGKNHTCPARRNSHCFLAVERKLAFLIAKEEVRLRTFVMKCRDIEIDPAVAVGVAPRRAVAANAAGCRQDAALDAHIAKNKWVISREAVHAGELKCQSDYAADQPATTAHGIPSSFLSATQSRSSSADVGTSVLV